MKIPFGKRLIIPTVATFIASSALYTVHSYVFPESSSSHGTTQQIVSEETTLPDKKEIQQLKHYNKIQDLMNNKSPKAAKDYVKNLNEKELFETAAEMVKVDKEKFEQSGMLLVPYIKEKWKTKPSKDAYKMLRDKGYDAKFRQHVIDAMLRNDISEASLNDENIVNNLTGLATDKSESKELRSYALKKLKPSKKINFNKLQLKSILKDPSEPVEVRGSALVAMNRTNDPDFKSISGELLDSTDTNSELYEYAVVEAAKDNLTAEYLDEIKETVLANDQDDLTSSVIFAMYIEGDANSLKLATEIYTPDQKDIAHFAFRNRMNTVKEMLNSTDVEYVKAGIKAATYGDIANLLPELNTLQSSENDELKELATQAIETINPDSLVDLSVLAKEED